MPVIVQTNKGTKAGSRKNAAASCHPSMNSLSPMPNFISMFKVQKGN